MMTRRAPIIAMSTVVLGIAPGSPARAAPSVDEAEYVRDVVGRAAAHVEEGRYEQALAVLDRAERERPLPVFVYVRATIEERRGDCERATALYRRFLELDVPAKDADDARRGIARCRGEPVEEPARPITSSQSDPEPVDPTSAGPSDVPPPRPWWTDPWGGALVGVGVLGVGVGAGLLGQSRVDARAADDAASLQTFDDRSRRAIALDRAGIATLAVGSALLLGGMVRYALVGIRPRRRATAFTVTSLVIRF